MKLIPENYSPEHEAGQVSKKAVLVCESECSAPHLSVSSGCAYIVCNQTTPEGKQGMLFVLDTSDGHSLCDPICFAKGDLTDPIILGIGKPDFRIYFCKGSEACCVGYHSDTGTVDSTPCAFAAEGIPFDTNRPIDEKYCMALKRENGVSLAVLNSEFSGARVISTIEHADSAQFAGADCGGYYAFVSGKGGAYLAKSRDGASWETLRKTEAPAGRPTFVRIGRQYYLATETKQGARISVSLDGEHYETLLQFKVEDGFSDFALFTWDGIVFYTALRNGKPVFGKLR